MPSKPVRAGERRPLLEEESLNEPDVAPTNVSRPYLRVVVPVFLNLMTSSLCVAIYNTAIYQIQERIICKQHYDDVVDSTTDPRCKGPAVQGEFSLLIGVQNTFELIPTLLSGILYGVVADTYGRKPVFVLCTFGAFLHLAADAVICRFPEVLPLKLVWASAMVTFIGGGAGVYINLDYTMVADVTSPSQRANVFFLLASTTVLGNLVGNFLAYGAMQQGDWFALYASLVIKFLIFATSFLFQETLSLKIIEQHDSSSVDTEDTGSLTTRVLARLKEPAQRTVTSLRTIFWTNKKLSVLLSSTFLTSIGTYLVKLIFLQYISKRYSLSWAQSSLIMSIKAFVQLGLILVVLPVLSHLLIQRGLSPISRDVWITRLSLFFAATGYAIVGFARDVPALSTGLVISALSYGLEPALRGLLVSVAQGEATALIFSTMGTLSGLGLAVAGPMMAALFRAGLRLGGDWMGLPLYFASAAMVPTLCVVMLFKLEGRDAQENEEERCE